MTYIWISGDLTRQTPTFFWEILFYFRTTCWRDTKYRDVTTKEFTNGGKWVKTNGFFLYNSLLWQENKISWKKSMDCYIEFIKFIHGVLR